MATPKLFESNEQSAFSDSEVDSEQTALGELVWPLIPKSLTEARNRVIQRLAELVEYPQIELSTDPVESSARIRLEQIQSKQSKLCLFADCVLWHQSWSQAELTELGVWLGTDGRLIFIEPSADTGWRMVVSKFLAKTDQVRCGHNFVRDTPRDLRRAGMVVTTTVRFRLGRKSYVWGEARNYSAAVSQSL